MIQQINHWLAAFNLDELLRAHIAAVLIHVPDAVRDDLMSDPAFVLYDYEPGLATVMVVPVGFPGRGRPGRSVVLKRTLRLRPEPFIRWVIAHEFAHAHLRNGGRWADDDPELAADALAADWGFPRPVRAGFRFSP